MTDDNPTKRGNVWMITANIIRDAVRRDAEGPQVLTMDADGQIESVSSRHPEYEARLLWPGFVCTLSEASDLPRIAGRIRTAALAVAREHGA